MASETTIYHNPRCSKSRATLALLEERGVAPTVVEYLKMPPDAAQVEALLRMLGKEPRDVMRTGEDAYAELGLSDTGKTRDELIAAIVAHPILLERPIVVVNGRAAIGRPPESVLSLFDAEGEL